MTSLPSVLVIGAQKSGTTSFCGDLEDAGFTQFGSLKESRALLQPSATRRRMAYKMNYARVDRSTGLADGSTDYSKRTLFPGVASRARQLLGPDVRILYVLRDPMERLRSHYLHDLDRGLIAAEGVHALTAHPQLIDNGRYGYQLEPWELEFGLHRILPLSFESYIANRRDTLERVATFLDVPLAAASHVAEHSPALNVRGEGFAASGAWRGIVENNLYRHIGRRLVPQRLKTRVLGNQPTSSQMSLGLELVSETEDELKGLYRQDAAALIARYPGFDAPWCQQ